VVTSTRPTRVTKDTITWTVPLADVGNPAPGAGLYSATGSSTVQPQPSTASTQTLPTSGDIANTQLPLLLDAAPSFSYTVPADAPSTALPEIEAPGLLVLVGTGLVAVPLIRRRRRHTAP